MYTRYYTYNYMNVLTYNTSEYFAHTFTVIKTFMHCMLLWYEGLTKSSISW